MGTRYGCGPCGIKWRGNLNHIATTNVDPGQLTQQNGCLCRCQPAPDRRSGSGGKGRVQPVNVESQVTGVIAHDLTRARGHGRSIAYGRPSGTCR